MSAATSRAERAYERMHRRWAQRCPAVAESLAEAGHELLTFYAFPSDQWKALRSTNLIERIHGELRRRIKTQATWSTEHGLPNLLHGLFAAGIIRFRRIDGFHALRPSCAAREAA